VSTARIHRDHLWVSILAIVIVAGLGFGVLFQITQSIASTAEAASFTSEPF
jgi:hypothetical protein